MLGAQDRVRSVIDIGGRVMSVKGKKVLHIDRNDHYGGCVDRSSSV